MKVNMENIEEKYKGLFKENMTRQEMSLAGMSILKDKLFFIKQKIKKVLHR